MMVSVSMSGSCEDTIAELELVLEAAQEVPLVLVLGMPGSGKGQIIEWICGR